VSGTRRCSLSSSSRRSLWQSATHRTTRLFGEDSARPAENHTAIIEFKVDDVDGEYQRLRSIVREWIQKPTTMPWGNRSILFRDPDGNLVNLFTPVTEDAINKFNAARPR